MNIDQKGIIINNRTMKWGKNAFLLMKRSAHQVLDVTKANFRIRTTCYFLIVFCFLFFSCDCVVVVGFFQSEHHYYSFVLPLQSTLQGFTPFFVWSLLLRSAACCARTQNIFGVKKRDSVFSLCFAFRCLLCKCMHRIHIRIGWIVFC